MPFSPLSDTFRTSAISLCGTSLPDPIGFSIDEAIGAVESRPGTRVSPAVAYDSYGCMFVGRTVQGFTPVAHSNAAPATSSATLLDISGATHTIQVVTTIPWEFKANGNTKPHEFEQSAKYTAGNSENVNPVSYS